MWIDVDTAVTLLVTRMPLMDSTDFKSRETAIAFNASGMDLVWNFTTTAGVVTQTAVTPSNSGNYLWTNVGKGFYKIQMPASGGATINNDAEGYGQFTGICDGVLAWVSFVYGFRAAGLNDLLIDSAYSTERGLAGTALPAAAAEAAGGLYTRGTGAGQINQANNGQIDANAARTGGTTNTGRDIGASVLLSSGTGTGQISLSSGAVTLSAAAVQAIWDALTSAFTTVGSVGKRIVDNLDTAVSSRATTTSGGSIVTGTDNKVLLSNNAGSFPATPVQAIWDALTSALSTSNSIGKRIVDFLTGDIYARLGAPAGASVSADIAAVKSDTAATLADTGTDGVVVAAASKTGYRLSATGVDDVWDEVMEGSFTARQFARGFAAALLGELSGAGTTTIEIRDASDTKVRITATVDASGNRSVVVLDLT